MLRLTPSTEVSMSKVLEQLQRQRAEYLRQFNELRDDLRDLDLAIAAIKSADDDEAGGDRRRKLRVTDALELAIKAGCGSPADMQEYLARELDVETTRATISSTLSRMRETHDIQHDGTRWIYRKASDPDGSPSGAPSHVNGAATDAPEASDPGRAGPGSL